MRCPPGANGNAEPASGGLIAMDVILGMPPSPVQTILGWSRAFGIRTGWRDCHDMGSARRLCSMFPAGEKELWSLTSGVRDLICGNEISAVSPGSPSMPPLPQYLPAASRLLTGATTRGFSLITFLDHSHLLSAWCLLSRSHQQAGTSSFLLRSRRLPRNRVATEPCATAVGQKMTAGPITAGVGSSQNTSQVQGIYISLPMRYNTIVVYQDEA